MDSGLLSITVDSGPSSRLRWHRSLSLSNAPGTFLTSSSASFARSTALKSRFLTHPRSIETSINTASAARASPRAADPRSVLPFPQRRRRAAAETAAAAAAAALARMTPHQIRLLILTPLRPIRHRIPPALTHPRIPLPRTRTLILRFHQRPRTPLTGPRVLQFPSKRASLMVCLPSPFKQPTKVAMMLFFLHTRDHVSPFTYA
mmetsp:Transcript_17092/g.33463  ORF Transcript_17092/g.33463 Transcript_17092/m.33463 type:complete len:204 (+) Transcript_17092:1140-1751(+)